MACSARDFALLSWLAGAVGACAVACGPPKEVVIFNVAPPFVCPGERATVQWEVRGRAWLRAERDAGDWDEGEVLSKGKLDLAPAVTTVFTVTALDANPAKGRSNAQQTVQVPSDADRTRAASAHCDAGPCTGTFTITSNRGAARVAKVGAPLMVRGGIAKPVSLTVTHGTWSMKVPATGEVAAYVPADGPWTLSMTLPEGEPTTPPPQLRVTLDFDCN